MQRDGHGVAGQWIPPQGVCCGDVTCMDICARVSAHCVAATAIAKVLFFTMPVEPVNQ